MIHELQDFSEDVARLSSADAVWSRMANLAEDRGMPFCTLTMARRETGLHSSQFISSLPDEFRDNYREGGLIGDDPFLSLICRNMTAAGIVTDGDRFPETNGRQGAFLELTRSFGVKTALCIPVRTIQQSEFGGWVIGGTTDGPAFDRICETFTAELHLAGLMAFERLTALAHRARPAHGRLSPRERECMLWLSAGLRVAKIAHRLDISESAVALYITNARRKLGARTREQAVARAIMSGEIEP